VPIFSTLFVCYPYALLETGTLYSYSFSIALIPLLLASTLAIMRSITLRLDGEKMRLARGVLFFAVSFVLILLAQPRALFLYAVIILPFVVLWIVTLYKLHKERLRRPLIFTAFGLFAAVCLVGYYALTHLNKALILHPENWFPLEKPFLSTPEALFNFMSGTVNLTVNMFGISALPTSYLLFVAVLAALAVSVNSKIKCMIPMLFSYLLLLLLYIFATSADGGLARLVTAPWYKNGYRLFPGLVIVAVSIFAFALYAIVHWIEEHDLRPSTLASYIVVFTLLAALVFYRPDASAMKNLIQNESSITNSFEERLTSGKIDTMAEVAKITPPNAVIVGDPFNGSSYIYSLYNRDVAFPTLNPILARYPKGTDLMFGFKDGNTGKVCAFNHPNNAYYFLDLGKPAFIGDPIHNQYAGFHDQTRISKYQKSGFLTKVKSFDSGYALYKINCG
jgi:hypothetical protein